VFDGAGDIGCGVLYENVNMRKVAPELLRDFKLAGTGGEVAGITGGLRAQAACLGATDCNKFSLRPIR
jgi:hypothetical protein